MQECVHVYMHVHACRLNNKIMECVLIMRATTSFSQITTMQVTARKTDKSKTSE